MKMPYHPKKQKKRNYHPHSWSAQARDFADRLIYGAEMIMQDGVPKEEAQAWVMEILQNSYRAPLITKRAAKRLHRKGY